MKAWLKKHLVRGPLGLEETVGVLIHGQYQTHVASVKVLAPPDPEKNNPEIYGEVSFHVVGHSNSLITLFSRESDKPDLIDLAAKDNYLTLSDDHHGSPRVLPQVSTDNPLHVTMRLFERKEDSMIADIDHCESCNGVNIGYCFVLEGEKGFKFEVCYSVVLGALVEVEAEITKVGEGDRATSCQVLAYQCLGEDDPLFPSHPFRTRSLLKTLYCNDPLILEVGKRIDLDRRFVVAPMWKDGYLRIRITPSIDEDDGFSERHDLLFPLAAFYNYFKGTLSFLTNNHMTHTKCINLSSGTEISISIRFVVPDEQIQQTNERMKACWKEHIVSVGPDGNQVELIDAQYQTHVSSVRVLAPPDPEKNENDPDCKIYGEVSFDVVGHPESLITLFSRERDNPDQIDLADDESYLTLSDHHQSPRVLPRVSRNNPLHVKMRLFESKEGSDEDVMIADIDHCESGNGVDSGYCFVLEGERGFKFEVCYSVVLGALVEVDAQITEAGKGDSTLSCQVLAYQCLGEGDPLFPSHPARTCSSLKNISYDKPLPLTVGTHLDLERRFVVMPVWDNGYLRIRIHSVIDDDDDDEFSEPRDLEFPLAAYYNFFKGTLSFLTYKEMTHTKRINLTFGTEISVSIKFVRPVIS